MRNKYILLILGLLVSFLTIKAQTWTQIGTDIIGEAENDFFGRSVSINSDGSIVAIGAEGNDGNSPNSGHVRIYQNISGTWTQIGDDIDGEAEWDSFGWSVSLNSDGMIVAIGATLNDGNGSSSGHVRIFENIGGIWTQIGDDIDGEDNDDKSGYSVSLNSDGSVVAIGSPFHDNGTNYDIGHVRIFENIEGVWSQIGNDIEGEAKEDESGCSVSLSSDGLIIAIGAKYNDGNGSKSGHVRIYQNMEGIWTQIGEDIDGEAVDDEFGFSVCLNSDGSILASGAYKNDGNGSSSGHVRIFQNNEGTWTQIGADIDGEEAYDWFGYSVSLSPVGSVVAIGAPLNDGNGSGSGQVRIYQKIAGTWTQIGNDINGKEEYDYSGKSVSLNSNAMVVAIDATENDGNGNNSGCVRIYELDTPYQISNHPNNKINIYPNPTTGIINLEFVGKKIRQIKISDITGKIIFEKTIKTRSEEIDLTNYMKGIYIIIIQTDKNILTSKIIKR